MRVVASNSGCCGLKHIRDFVYSPDVMIKPPKKEGHDEDVETSEPEPYENWEKVPESPEPIAAGDYLAFLVTQIKERRPHGMIDVNLEAGVDYDDDDDGDDVEYADDNIPRDFEKINEWTPVLEALGFTYIDYVNSNSNAVIRHFTLVY